MLPVLPFTTPYPKGKHPVEVAQTPVRNAAEESAQHAKHTKSMCYACTCGYDDLRSTCEVYVFVHFVSAFQTCS
jgi:hypothetical protein